MANLVAESTAFPLRLEKNASTGERPLKESGPVSGNEALDGRLKDDAVQRGYASWDEALKANRPEVSGEQDTLAKLLSGAWG